MDGCRVGDRNYLITTDFPKIKRDKIDPTTQNPRARKLLENVTRRAKHVCENYPSNAT
jgi:hypothetical protein